MNRKEIVKRLEETALLLDLDGANPFRIRSFENVTNVFVNVSPGSPTYPRNIPT